MGAWTTLAWITNPYPNYYTHLKALAGEVYFYLPVSSSNLCYTGFQTPQETTAPSVVDRLLGRDTDCFEELTYQIKRSVFNIYNEPWLWSQRTGIKSTRQLILVLLTFHKTANLIISSYRLGVM